MHVWWDVELNGVAGMQVADNKFEREGIKGEARPTRF